MTFKHKLSRRLALLKDATALGALALVASCEKPVPLGPSGPDVTQLIVVPDSTTLQPAQSRQFAAFGRTQAGDSIAVAVAWSAVGGAISASGLYTADSLEGDYVVQATLGSPTATQAAASGAAATAAPSGRSVVHVRRTRALAQVFVTPTTASLPTGGTQQFAAYGRLNVGDSVAVAVTWSATGGSISPGGLYTAGSTTGAYAVTANSSSISSTATVTVASAPVATVSIAPSSASLFAGGTLQLVATPRDLSGNPLSGRAVTWSTSNGAAATVSATGLVTAVAAGSAMITATSEGQNGTATIDVSNVPVASVVVNPTTANLLVGQTTQLAASTRDSAGNVLVGRAVSWSSSNGGVAAVSSSGLVTAGAAGSTTVSATSEGKTATATITVASVPVASVSVSPAAASIFVGATRQLAAVTKDSAGNTLSGRTVTWSSTNATVATVSASGLVTGKASGSATLTAMSEGKTGSATITVANVPVASVAVNPASASVLVGASQQLSVVTKDSAGNTLTGRVITWSSSNTTVAPVSAGGLVTGQAAGSATITGTSEGKSGTATITVQAPPPPPPPGSHAGYYVAPSGSAGGNGSAGQPWDLATALNSAVVQPGDTVWLRGGTYSGSFTSNLAGTVVQPIIVRQYPGEHATISGNLTVLGHDVWFWGFEVVNPNPTGPRMSGINSRAPRAKYINLVVHDASATGIGLFDGADLTPAPDGEIYGSIIYNNGTLDNNDHGIYVYNNTGTKTIRDNIVFDNWSIGVQAYATGPKELLNNIHIIGNIAFNDNTIGTSGGFEILLGGSGVAAAGGLIDHNYTYRNNSAKSVDIGWYYASANQDVTITNNYIAGLLEVDDWTTAVVTGNTVYSTTPAAVYSSGQLINRGNLSGHTYGGNVFYGDPTASRWGYTASAGPGSISPINFTSWQTATGLGNAGAFAGSRPPDLVVVRPNVYELGRANIAIYNWSGQSTVSVDVAGVLSIGQPYVVMSVFDMYGTPVAQGTYTGGPLQLSMTALPAPAPIGRGHAGPATGNTFNAFVLTKTP